MKKFMFPPRPALKPLPYRSPVFWVLMFFSLSFLGWLWEVLVYFYMEHHFVNRGFLMGPFLPVYGSGGILLCLLLSRFRQKPLVLFCGSVLISTLVEYFTSFLSEYVWGIRFWDYSGFSGNIQGRICLVCSLSFGLAGLLLFYVFLPSFLRYFHRISGRSRILLCLLLLAFFLPDIFYSLFMPNHGPGITYR